MRALHDVLALPGTGITSGIVHKLAGDLLQMWWQSIDRTVGAGSAWIIRAMWRAMSATAHPVFTTSAFASEYGVMGAIAVAAVVPLFAIAAIQAIAHQDAGGLLRTALVRLPLALLFTAVAVQLVQLALDATDQASTAVLSAGGDPSRRLVDGLAFAASLTGGPQGAGFAALFVLVVAAIVGFFLWLELAVRGAAVAVAVLFLPLALAGAAWPGTAHWCRRLGETLTGLVLMKLVMAAVLSLAAGALANPTGGATIGISGAIEGLALLCLAAFAPFALMRLIPMVEAGAVGHLEGLGRRGLRVATSSGLTMGRNAVDLAGLLGGLAAAGKGLAGGSEGEAGGAGSGSGSSPGPVPGPLGSGPGPRSGGSPGSSGASASRGSGFIDVTATEARAGSSAAGVPERGPHQFDPDDLSARTAQMSSRLRPPAPPQPPLASSPSAPSADG